MSETPQREIEQRLRAAAARRRADAGESFVLHPADRQHLHAEIARAFRHPPSPKPAGWLLWLWRHRLGLAMGSGLALVMLVTATVPFATASKKKSAPRSPAIEAAGSVAARSVADEAPPALASEPMPALSKAEAVVVGASASLHAEARADRRDAVAALAQKELPPVAAPKDADPVAVPLREFRLEQQGSSITVRDADGSIYTGRVETVPAAPAQSADLREATRQAAAPEAAARFRSRYGMPAPAASGGSLSATAPMGLFQVAGTNRTLQQGVVLRGSLPQISPNVATTQQWIRRSSPVPFPAAAPTAARQTAAPATNAVAPLTGELQVGREQPVPFQADPARR